MVVSHRQQHSHPTNSASLFLKLNVSKQRKNKMSALRDQIKREISECKAKCEGNPAKTWGMEYFNNFFCNLPDCFPKGALTHTRTGCQSIMPQHVPLRELGCTNLSDLRLNQSYADFYRAVDDALVTEGIPLEKVVR